MNRERIAPVASVAGSISVQTGAALGATLFPLIGPLGVVAVRQAVAAAAKLGRRTAETATADGGAAEQEALGSNVSECAAAIAHRTSYSSSQARGPKEARP